MVKKFPDRVCWEVCKDIKINTKDQTSFVASDYFPAGFTVTTNNIGEPVGINLDGMVAPTWKLQDAEGHETALSDLQSKVLLIQFTGIGCGPCYQSIPCLIKLRDQFTSGDFEIISIETWNNNKAVIKKHLSGNQIDYLYLIGDQAVKQNYANRSVPQFFVLDEKRVIRKIIAGFNKEKTCAELKEIVDKILNPMQEEVDTR
jgi:peroxiredoxin